MTDDAIRRECEACGELVFDSQNPACPHPYDTSFTKGLARQLNALLRKDTPTPVTTSTEHPHVLSKDCWCNPVVEVVPPGDPRVHGTPRPARPVTIEDHS